MADQETRRSSRRKRVKEDSKFKALQQVKERRQKGIKRSDQFEVQEEPDIFQEVDEATYHKIVEDRQKDQFVEDDGNIEGEGYQDDGEEVDWEAEDEEMEKLIEEAEPKRRSKKRKGEFKAGYGGMGKMGGKKKETEDEDTSQPNLKSMFMAMDKKAALTGKLGIRVHSTATKSNTKDFNAALEDFKSNPSLGSTSKRKIKKPKASRRILLGQDGPTDVIATSVYAAAPVDPKTLRKQKKEPEEFALPPPRAPDAASAPIGGDDMDTGDLPEPQEAVEKSVFDKKEEEEEKIKQEKEEEDDNWWENLQESMKPIDSGPLPQPLSPPVMGSPVTLPQTPPPIGFAPLPTRVETEADFEPHGFRQLNAPFVHMYMLDAWSDEMDSSGKVYVFGKVFTSQGMSSSICVVVQNIQRNVFILPSESIRTRVAKSGTGEEAASIHLEFQKKVMAVLKAKGIRKSLSKMVKRRYAFEDMSIPRGETDWLKVVYDFPLPALSNELKDDAIGAVFGSNTPALEHFLIKRKIRGPQWIRVYGFTEAELKQSWCKYEITVDDPKKIISLNEDDSEPPTLTCLSLHVLPIQNHQTRSNDIVCVGGVVHRNVVMDGPTPNWENGLAQFTAVRKLDGQEYPLNFVQELERQKAQGDKPLICNSERELLNYVLAKLQQLDPDVLVGHNFIGYDLDVMLHRMSALKVAHWSRLGRLRRVRMPKLQVGAGGTGDSTWAERQVVSGRLVLDTYLAAKEHIRSPVNSLEYLANKFLNHTRINIEASQIAPHFGSTEGILALTGYVVRDAFLALSLNFRFQLIPLTKQLTNLAGNLWQRSLQGSRADRNEHLLLHTFHNDKYIVPDKPSFKGKTRVVVAAGDDDDNENVQVQGKPSRSKPKYSGGLVLEPKKGHYDKYILLLDFNSLYPSIIQEYNLDFATVERPKPLADGTEPPAALPPPITSDDEMGRLPRLLKSLVDRRRQLKNLIKDEKSKQRPDNSKLQQWDIRQMALKLTANSMYGCLGFSASRFYARPIAELITTRGREVLQDTVRIANDELGLEVVYGDTDSIMVNTMETDLVKVKEIGRKVMSEINKKYRKLEIDIDGIFSTLLLLRKKKYAALVVQEREDGTVALTREVKGLDQVRRDWCKLSKKVGDYVLDQILSGGEREEVVERIHEHLRTVKEDMLNNRIMLSDYVITKGLTKAPEEYPDARHQPHVQVALRMRKNGVPVRTGDTIEYAICKETLNSEGEPIAAEPSISYALRAFSPTEIMSASGKISVDIDWYMSQQIHPPVSRLCAPIEGTDASQLASCLGLDASKFSHAIKDEDFDARVAYDRSQGDDKTRFRDCEPVKIKCKECAHENVLQGPAYFERSATITEGGGTWKCGIKCTECDSLFSETYLWAIILTSSRIHIDKYMEGWRKCDDSSCATRTRQFSLQNWGKACTAHGCSGLAVEEYTSQQLYLQLLYYKSLFDMDRMLKQLSDEKQRGANKAMETISDGTSPLEVVKSLSERIDGILDVSGYHTIDLNHVFRQVFVAGIDKTPSNVKHEIV